MLVVPYTDTIEVEEADKTNTVRKLTREQTAHWTFFPTTLDVRGPLTPSTRKRGLHEVRVYEWKASANARFDVTIPRDTPPRDVAPGRVRRIGRP